MIEEPANIDAEPKPGFFDPPGSELHVQKWRDQVDHRLETMARVLAEGVNAKTIRNASRALNVKPELIKLWVTDPQVIKKAATYATAMALPQMAEKAKEDVQAFKTVAGIAGLIESGPRVTTNVAIDARDRGNTAQEAAWFNVHQKRLREGLRQAVEVKPD